VSLGDVLVKAKCKHLKNYGSPTLYSPLPLGEMSHFLKMQFVVAAGGGFLFYNTTQYIMLDMESRFVQMKRDFMFESKSLCI